MADEAAQIERIRAKLYDFVSNNPGHADAEQARRILSKLPKMNVKGPSGAPGSDEHEAETGAGEPEFVEAHHGAGVVEVGGKKFGEKGYRKVNGRVREQTPYEQSSIDPTAQELVKQMVLGGVGKFAGGLLGKAIANTRGARLAETVAEANGPFDPAAEKAAEALKFKLVPEVKDMGHMAVAGAAGGYFHHPVAAAIASFLAKNLVPVEGAIYQGAASRLLPPALGAAGTAVGGGE
jgi:hypothetical protein